MDAIYELFDETFHSPKSKKIITFYFALLFCVTILFLLPAQNYYRVLNLSLYTAQYWSIAFLFALRSKADKGKVRVAWILLAIALFIGGSSTLTRIWEDPTIGYPPYLSLPIFVFMTASLIFLSWDGVLSISRTRVFLEALWLSTLFLLAAWHPLIRPFSQLQTADIWDQVSFAVVPITGILAISLCLAVINQSSSKEITGFIIAGITIATICIASSAEIWYQEIGQAKYFEGYDYIWHLGVPFLAALSQVSFEWQTKNITKVKRSDNRILSYLSLLIGFGVMLFTVPSNLTAFVLGFGVLIGLITANLNAVNLENRHLTSELRDLALNDYLTGLPNRRGLMEHLDQKSKDQYGLLFIDLDYFKEVNDTYGHEAGDEVLKEVSHRLKKSLRENDFISRLGGDEFVIVIENSDEKKVLIVAQKLKSMMDQEFIFSNGSAKLGMTIGVYAGQGLASSQMLDKADKAMFEAKRSRRQSDSSSDKTLLEIV